MSWENRLVLFVGHLIETNKKSNTIRSYISAIKAVLNESGIFLSENTFLISSLIRSCRIHQDKLTVKLPIKKALLGQVIKKIYQIFSEQGQPYLASLYSAIFAAAYFGMFRIEELTKSPHVLKARDTFIATNKCKMQFILWTSKTHSRGDKPQVIKISSSKSEIPKDGQSSPFCPFEILQRFIKIRPKSKKKSEQFFVFSDNSPVKASHVRAILKTCLARLKLNPSLYTVHGMRAGRSLDLLKYGVSVETIKQMGRWKSNAVFTYLKY